MYRGTGAIGLNKGKKENKELWLWRGREKNKGLEKIKIRERLYKVQKFRM